MNHKFGSRFEKRLSSKYTMWPSPDKEHDQTKLYFVSAIYEVCYTPDIKSLKFKKQK